jgi:glucose/arabinose dehydrogenase
MWATEHGPTGGDELNRIERGHNYGWPLVTSGKMFPARPSPATPVDTTAFDAPITAWSPSIGPGGIAFYTGDRFPNWKHHLFVTGLAGEALRRLETDGDRVVHEEIVFKGFGRVRDVITGPDGLLYIALNVPGVRLSDTTPGLVVRRACRLKKSEGVSVRGAGRSKGRPSRPSGADTSRFPGDSRP